MNYKSIIFFLLSTICFNAIKAQVPCDSTYTLCDSISIDSIFITSSAEIGDRLHFRITVTHDFLNGPIFIICTEDEDIEFEDINHLFSGIVGPVTLPLFYDFLNFEVVSDTIKGHLVLDDFNNSFPNCIMPFEFSINNETTNDNIDKIENEIDIFPNPTREYLFINLRDNALTGDGFYLFDLMGRKHDLVYDNPKIDISQMPKGMYILTFEVNHSIIISEKIIIR